MRHGQQGGGPIRPLGWGMSPEAYDCCVVCHGPSAGARAAFDRQRAHLAKPAVWGDGLRARILAAGCPQS